MSEKRVPLEPPFDPPLDLPMGPQTAESPGPAPAASPALASPALASPAPPGTLPFPSRPAAGSSTHPLRETDAEVVPMRPREKVKRLKSPLWVRLLRPLAMALLIVGFPAMAVVWLLTSPSFALQETRFAAFSQSRRVPVRWVENTLQGFQGRNIWQVPLADVEMALRRHPWVESVGLRKEPPRTLVVNIVEKAEVALYRQGSELKFVDERGKVIDRYDPRLGAVDLPIFSGGDPNLLLPGAIALLHELETAQPTWSLSELEILGEHDFRLFVTELPFPLLVRAGTLGEKTRSLQGLLPQMRDRYEKVEAVDLRFARRIIVQPMETPATTAKAGAAASS